MLGGFGGAYTFSAFVGPLATAFRASRGPMSLVFSLAGFLYFALGVVSGPLADRWGSQRLAILGMLIMGAGLVLAGLAADLISVYLAYGLGVGLGVGLAYVPAIGAVRRRFVRRRGLASGPAASSIGVGTLVMPPMASAHRYARLATRLHGLRPFVAVVGPGLRSLIANDPNDHGLAPDGDGVAHNVSGPSPSPFTEISVAGHACRVADISRHSNIPTNSQPTYALSSV
jgi:MFS transporter, OFA family, oxalate/formate antiporter